MRDASPLGLSRPATQLDSYLRIARKNAMQAPLVHPVSSSYSIRNARGFTLTELILVLVITGILAIAVLPRFINTQTFEARGYYDQAMSMIRYGQKVAVAQGRPVFVNVSAANRTICLTYDTSDAGCTAPGGVPNPGDRTGKFSLKAPESVSFSTSVTFAFTALGKPSPDAAVTFSIDGDGMTRTVAVERETGYVH